LCGINNILPSVEAAAVQDVLSKGHMPETDRSPIEDLLPAGISLPFILKLSLEPALENLDLIYVLSDYVNEACLKVIPEVRAKAEAEGKDVVIFVTYTDGDRGQEVLALEAGADDCYPITADMRKAFLVPVRAALARRKGLSRDASRMLSVDPLTHRALVRGRPIAVSPLEFRFLLELHYHRGEVVPREKLAIALWGVSDPSYLESLRQLVHRLRLRLGPAAEAIVTIPRVGYLLERKD